VFFTYGFALQERSLSFEMPDEIADEPRRCSLASPPANMSTSPEAMVEHAGKPGYDYGDEFGFGIDLILEALQQRHIAAPAMWHARLHFQVRRRELSASSILV
jgi:hypothetical protein